MIAEGIERVEQLELLRSWGCQFGQGNYLCAATDQQTVEEILEGEWVPGQPLAVAN